MSELRRWASAALSWIDEIYPADIFDGSSGDEGPVRIVEIRENLRQALTDTATETGQGPLEPLKPLRTDDEIRDSVFNAGWMQASGLVVLQTGAARGLLEALRNRYEVERAKTHATIAAQTQRIAALTAGGPAVMPDDVRETISKALEHRKAVVESYISWNLPNTASTIERLDAALAWLTLQPRDAAD